MKLTHKNYSGEYFYSPSDVMFSGRIIGIEDLIVFYGDSESEIETEFKKAVETYIKLNDFRCDICNNSGAIKVGEFEYQQCPCINELNKQK